MIVVDLCLSPNRGRSILERLEEVWCSDSDPDEEALDEEGEMEGRVAYAVGCDVFTETGSGREAVPVAVEDDVGDGDICWRSLMIQP
jgi:hypothetical protein